MTITERPYAAAIEAWREQVEATLRADDGWLTVAGLFWLEEGANTIGTDPSSDMVLPEGAAPGTVGTLHLRDGRVTLDVAPGVELAVNKRPASGAVALRSADQGGPDLVTIGALTFFVHNSGERLAIRLRDRNAPARRDFTGRVWYPIREEYRVVADFHPYDSPVLLPIVNIVGDKEESLSPGYLTFRLNGQDCQLDAIQQLKSGFWLHYSDQTADAETYPGGHFLTTGPLDEGKVTLDFNRAVNPPCAFTPFATCPVVLPQNKLAVRVEAGERWSGAGH